MIYYRYCDDCDGAEVVEADRREDLVNTHPGHLQLGLDLGPDATEDEVVDTGRAHAAQIRQYLLR